MTPSTKAGWTLVAATGVVIALIGIYFLHIGMSRSNGVSGVAGVFVGVLGLALSSYSILQARRPGGSDRGVARMSQRSGSDSINIQAGRDLKMGDNNKIGD
jgi:hypothetical protein